ncbi:hypothetical protein GGI42DRAFT_363628 [Trichoderma sp. SZMC 28013]
MDPTGFCNLDDEDPSKSLSFDLYEDLNHEATQQSGSLKSYEVKQHGGAIYDRKESGHCVTVERLLWVDGWGYSTVDGENTKSEQEMTLVVLKIVLAPQNPKKKFRYMRASLIFEDIEESGVNEPQVQAWAPFRAMTRWNKTVAHHTKSGKREGSVEVSCSVTSATGSWSSESEVSWDRTAFDEGRSNSIISQKTGNRNGVTWVVNQNNIENAGITQELWVAVLLSRPTAEPYLTRFEINTRVGTMEDFKNKTRAFFGLDPDRTKPFKVTPWVNQLCCYEGKDIMKCIDINNLDTLRCASNGSTLDMKWGPNFQIETGIIERPGTTMTIRHIADGSQSKSSPVSEETLDQTATPAEEPVIPVAAGTI